MKRLLIILFIIISIKSYGQLPNQVGQGSELTEWWQKGITGADLGIRWRMSFADTTAANNYKGGILKNIAGLTIRTVDFFWSRSNDLTKWNIVNGSITAVTTVYRTPGIDSIYFIINGTPYAIKDSIGSGGSGSDSAVRKGYGTIIDISGASRTISVDSLQLSTRAWRQKGVDSLVVYTKQQIKDTVQKILDYLVLDEVTDFSTFASYANSVIVKDTTRGGSFQVYEGADAVDNGMIFDDALGRKWLRQTSTPVINARWYNMRAATVGDNHDNTPEFDLAYAYATSHSQFNEIHFPVDNTLFGVGDLRVGYRFNSTINITKPIRITGDGTYKFPKTQLWFDACTGFKINYTSLVDAFGANLENLVVTLGNPNAINEHVDSVHGIIASSFVHIKNILVSGYIHGAGLMINACAAEPSGDNNNLGNADESIVEMSEFAANLIGMRTEGCDANDIDISNCNFNRNLRWGLYINGTLGNSIYKPHLAFNGAGAGDYKTVVTYGGLYYRALPGYDGYNEDAADSNYNKRPDLNLGTYWALTETMAATAWNDSTRYFSGGTIYVKNPNAWCSVFQPYTEGFQPGAILRNRTVWNNGTNGAAVSGGAYINMTGIYTIANTSVNIANSLGVNNDNPLAPIDINVDPAAAAGLAMDIRNAGATTFCNIRNSIDRFYYGITYDDFFAGDATNGVFYYWNKNRLRPNTNNTMSLGESGATFKDIWATSSAGAGNKALRWNTGGKFTYVDTLIFSAGWGNLISGTYPNIIIGVDSSLLATKLYVKHYADSAIAAGGGGSMVYPAAGIAVSTGSAWTTSITDNSTNWNTAYTDRNKWDGGATGLTASTGRTSLGGTTIGQNIFTSTNPSAITFLRGNADNSVDWLSASAFRTAIGAGDVDSVNSKWSLLGNFGTTAGTNFIGTKDAVDFVVKTAGIEIARFKGDGSQGIIFGQSGTASGYTSLAAGNGSTASGYSAMALGEAVAASGNAAFAAGENSIASGNYSFAAGDFTQATGESSAAFNQSTIASGVFSSALGFFTRSKSAIGTVIGSYNDSTNAASSTSFNLLNRVFQIGIGTANNARANAMTVLFNGNVGLGILVPTATLHTSGTAKFDLGSDATGDIYYRNSSGFFTRLPIGTAAQTLHVVGGLPAWVDTAAGGGGSGTVNSGTQYRLAYYATTGTAVSEAAAITASRALVSDANGVPTHATTTATEIGYVNGVTSAIQTQLNGKQSTITFGTGVQTALGVNIGSAGAPVLFNGAGGTPSSLTGTNITGVPLTTGLTGGNWKTIYTNGSGVITELAIGTSGQVLTSNGTTSAPSWETPSGGGSGLTFAQVSALMIIKY